MIERKHIERGTSARGGGDAGVVLVIVLLALVLLAGLLFFVVNLGRQAQQRAQTQHAADAAAAAGAGWMVRSLNTVAMNNVSITRNLAAVNVLDAMPQAVQFTVLDQEALAEALDRQMPTLANRWLERELDRMRDAVEDELVELRPMDDLFNDSSFDMRDATHYRGPRGRGDLWRAMLAMDELSQGLMENLGPLAQAHAMHGGEANLTDENEAAGHERDVSVMVAPILPTIPWQRGTLRDFQRPVTLGRLPLAVDDDVTNRGPWDVLYGWRNYRRERGGWGGGQGNTQGGGPSGPGGSGPDAGGGQGGGSAGDPVEYDLYGPQERMLRQLRGYANRHLPYSRFANRGMHNHWVRQLVNIKSVYLWGSARPRQIREPEWITSYRQAVDIAESQPGRIHETAYVAVEIDSVYPRGHPSFRSAGSWAYIDPRYRNANHRGPSREPSALVLPGWVDYAPYEDLPSITRFASSSWLDEWSYETNRPNSGIASPGRPDSGGWYTIHRLGYYVFAGVNVGPAVEVPNPHNFSGSDPVPAPIDLDHAQVGHGAPMRHEHLSVLAAAWQGNPSLFMEKRFDEHRPAAGNLAVAQAGVFNDHSWDLWTQMWHAQLEPVDDFQAWSERLRVGVNDAPGSPLVDAEAVDQMWRRFDALMPLAPMFNH